MSKPTRLKFLPPDPGIAAVAWWGERLMAVVIATTLVTVRLTTRVPELVDMPDVVLAGTIVAAAAYVVVIIWIVVAPSRSAHQIGLPLGVLLFGSRAAWFVQLEIETGRGGLGNVAERLMLTASIIIYHVWGLWADRRRISDER